MYNAVENTVRDCIQIITDIRRKSHGKIISNWYNSFPLNLNVMAIAGKSTIVFWGEDNGVCRAYFASSNPRELKKILRCLPENTIIEYLTKIENEHCKVFFGAGWRLQVMQLRISSAMKEPIPINSKDKPQGRTQQKHRAKRLRMTPEEKEAALREALYNPDKVSIASVQDCDEIFDKLYEVFDVRESHLPTREELLQYINNKWVVVYRDEGKTLGFNIKKIQGYKIYGYQIWNGGGPEVYYSLMEKTDEVQWNLIPEDKRPHMVSYAWVNSNNLVAIRSAENGGANFDGLRNYIYEKTSKRSIGTPKDMKNNRTISRMKE